MEPYEFKLEVVPDFDPDRSTYASLGISKERSAEIEKNCTVIATDDNVKTNTGILAESVKMAQNNGEVAYICYIVGMAVARAQHEEMLQSLYGQLAAEGRRF